MDFVNILMENFEGQRKKTENAQKDRRRQRDHADFHFLRHRSPSFHL